MKRTLRHGNGTFRINELQYTGVVVRAVVEQGCEEFSAIKVLLLIDEIATVDEDGNVLFVNKDAGTWEPIVDMGVDVELGVDMDSNL